MSDRLADLSHAWLSTIEEVVEDARNGRMFILVDDEGRENEGDLVIPAAMADTAAVNFMAKNGRGLICLALTRDRVEHLRLALMTQRNRAPHQTAFTVSIEARDGVTTGISAADRAQTIAVAIDPAKNRDDLVVPGHVFPLIAQDGGVLVRAGHTEAAVDVARLAGLNPSGVICEIMNDDGSMARMPDLVAFAQTHGLKIATIADLIAYRRRTEKLVRPTADTILRSRFGGDFQMRIYQSTIDGGEHIALIKGDISGPEPVLVRMHQHHLLPDSLGDLMPDPEGRVGRSPRSGVLEASMHLIGDRGRGVIVIIREPPVDLGNQVRDRDANKAGRAKIGELKQYGLGAQILADLGVHSMTLLSNTPHSIVGLDGYGITLVGQEPLPTLK